VKSYRYPSLLGTLDSEDGGSTLYETSVSIHEFIQRDVPELNLPLLNFATDLSETCHEYYANKCVSIFMKLKYSTIGNTKMGAVRTSEVVTILATPMLIYILRFLSDNESWENVQLFLSLFVDSKTPNLY
jgi:hypothetical protein